MNVLHADFETRSVVDLKARGLDVYAEHASTEPLCLGFAFDDEPVDIWLPGDPLPERIAEHIRSGGLFYAHNAPFEFAIWNRVCAPRLGWPELRLAQMRCTMAMAYAMSLPGKLESLAEALQLDYAKDMKGHRVMMQLSKPRKMEWCGWCGGVGAILPHGACEKCYGEKLAPVWHDDQDKYDVLYTYCKTDVEVERAAHRRLLDLSPTEQHVWTLDRKINARGVQIDVAAAKAAVKLVDGERKRLDAEMLAVTGGAVPACSAVAALTAWLRGQGVGVPGVAKDDVVMLLSNSDALPPAAAQALRLRQAAGKTSTSKLEAMLSAMGANGRVRDTLQYHAAGTGRWGGRRIQPQNLKRPTEEMADAEFQNALIEGITAGRGVDWLRLMGGDPLDVVSQLLRGFIIAAPGHHLIAPDYSNIEGRKLAWLAGEQWKLEAFAEYDKGTGPDLYKVAAAAIYNADIKAIGKDKRQIGKVSELAMGFGGGVGAFVTMGETYGLTEDKLAEALPTIRASAPQEEIEAALDWWDNGGSRVMNKDAWMAAELVKRAWRRRHPKIVSYWSELESAAIKAVQNAGEIVRAGPLGRQVAFRVTGSFLWCQLPSGRCLCYPYPVIKHAKTTWGAVKPSLRYMTVDSTTNRWVEAHTYGGKLSENITQAAARDLLAEAIVRLEHRGFQVVMHVHDEIVVEVKESAPADTQRIIEEEMARLPQWAQGLPVTVEGWRGKRYRK